MGTRGVEHGGEMDLEVRMGSIISDDSNTGRWEKKLDRKREHFHAHPYAHCAPAPAPRHMHMHMHHRTARALQVRR